ncbi:unnamed protein product [Citrullus colocynthis]|uniref:Viral late gene transcription factor 3 zinc ribbon domain-containing protein n=1 Tax=Citrullus colocynthis TaxID=252529 RepID=A0ABP0YTG3_9ROSI
MEALPVLPISNALFPLAPTPNPTLRRSNTSPLKPRSISIQNRRRTAIFAAIDGASLAADPSQVEITWQIFVGAIAGVTPFVVAGIEFSKRIVAQKRCKECGGSGLVLRDDDYFRCAECGGFLPWQSWRRFFWG